MFDRAEIEVRSGNGGDGSIGFRREKFVPYGGPDGGDGGNGGDVVIRANANVDSLRVYRRNRVYRAGDGRNGAGSRKNGKNGENLVLAVPAGTIITVVGDGDVRSFLADLEKDGEEVVVARGGRGGWGNTHYTSSTNQAPRIAQRGESGEKKTLFLEMRLIADAGIIGYPNAGKSTLVTAASAARPRVADYPFTTLEPVLGTVEVGNDRFVLAEIPGLIEGAHRGRGLGHEFLRHALRTRVLVHLIDGASDSPVEDMLRVNKELSLYDSGLAGKPQIIVLNKIDLPEVGNRLDNIKKELSGAGLRAHYVSAATGEGVPGLMAEVLKTLKETAAVPEPAAKPGKVFRPEPREPGVKITREDDLFAIAAPGLDRLMAGVGVSPGELRWQLRYLLEKRGVVNMLEKAGIRPGDKVRCGELTWEW